MLQRSDPFTLHGQIVLVTGAGSGIGAASALLFAELGAKGVTLVGRRRDRLEECADRIRAAAPECEPLVLDGDLTETEFLDRIAFETNSRFCRLTALINNAGTFTIGSIENTPDEEWDRVQELNFTVPFKISKRLLPLLRASGGGSIVNIASTLGRQVIPDAAAYNASKGALIQLTRTMAIDQAKDQIRVNALLVGFTDTEMLRGRYDSPEAADQALREAAAYTPLGRIAQPRDIAYSAAFLCSPAASWITGAELAVDGGALLKC